MKNIQLAGSDNGLKLLQNGCTSVTELEPTEACPLTVSWAPTKVGAVIDDIQITHDGARGILVLPVRGTSSEAISVDSKPIVITQDSVNQPTAIIADGGEALPANAAASASVAKSSPANLDGYVVTSHSSKHAIIRGPIGSRIVADGKTTIIGGFEWNVKITYSGVQLTNANNSILLVFDRSLSNIGAGQSVGSSDGGGS